MTSCVGKWGGARRLSVCTGCPPPVPRGQEKLGLQPDPEQERGSRNGSFYRSWNPPWQAGDLPRMKPRGRAEMGWEGSGCRRAKAGAVLGGEGASSLPGGAGHRGHGKQDRQGPADFTVKLSGNSTPCGRPPLLPVRGQEGQTAPAFLGAAGGTHARAEESVETWPWSEGLSSRNTGLPCLFSRHSSWASVRGTMARPGLADSGVRGARGGQAPQRRR